MYILVGSDTGGTKGALIDHCLTLEHDLHVMQESENIQHLLYKTFGHPK